MTDREICIYCNCVKGRHDPCGCRGETARNDVLDLSFRLSRAERERDEAREALVIAAEACRLNLIHCATKDEQALHRAYQAAKAVLNK